jgi:hypothetical protein
VVQARIVARTGTADLGGWINQERPILADLVDGDRATGVP